MSGHDQHSVARTEGKGIRDADETIQTLRNLSTERDGERRRQLQQHAGAIGRR